ncbi:heme exporter subunit; membrane component of ABC superfamily [Burkholderiales bacterium 8X]|nr:heme exporter subunit; membrane component of ABC superfamily [Burkholderiales bacterium 8X]
MSTMTLPAVEPPATGAWNGVRCIVARDLCIALRRPADSAAVLFFFVIVVSLVPLGIGPEPELLRRVAPGMVWVAALLASMLSLSRLFADDLADGTLEQQLLSPTPLALLVLGKAFVHWLCSGLPLALVAPLLAIQFGLSWDSAWVLVASLLLGTPVLSLVGSIGAALTVGVRGAGVLLSLLVLPLVIPVLIFGAAAVDASLVGADVAGHFSLLAAMLVLAVAGAPLAAAAALRIALD